MSDDFANRKNNIFNSLECAEKTMIAEDSILHQSKNNADLLSSTTSTLVKNNLIETNKFRGKKESIFKTPALPISKCLKPRSAPGYQVNKIM